MIVIRSSSDTPISDEKFEQLLGVRITTWESALLALLDSKTSVEPIALSNTLRSVQEQAQIDSSEFAQLSGNIVLPGA